MRPLHVQCSNGRAEGDRRTLPSLHNIVQHKIVESTETASSIDTGSWPPFWILEGPSDRQ